MNAISPNQSPARWLRAFAGLCLWVAAATPAFAQAPAQEPKELVARREEHLRAMQRVTIPVLTSYLRSLESLRGQVSRENRLDAALVIDNEIREVTRQLETAQKAAANTGASMGLQILSATYGAHEKKRVVDITKNVRKVFESGATMLKLNTDEGAERVDPAPFAVKETVITYTIGGKKKQKTFREGHTLKFKEELD